MSKRRPTDSRMAHCSYGQHAPAQSKESLPFWEDRRPGSAWAKRNCGVCGYAPEAHTPEVAARPHLAGRTQHQFVEHPGKDTDTYYCGCYGWD